VVIGGRRRAPHRLLDSLDRLGLALDALMLGTRPPDGIQPLTGIREAYHLLSGDYEMNGVFQPERVMLANVNSSTMASLVANALNKRWSTVQSYQQVGADRPIGTSPPAERG
jgi:hypothetical protein